MRDTQGDNFFQDCCLTRNGIRRLCVLQNLMLKHLADEIDWG